MKSCKKATYLMSKQLDAQLGFSEKLSLKIHLMMCGNCHRCNKQLQTVHHLCAQRSTDLPNSSDKA